MPASPRIRDSLRPVSPRVPCPPLALARVVAVVAAILLGAGPASANPASAAGGDPSRGLVVRRFALITGATAGGPGRVPLRYAGTDARAVQHVLTELGGVPESGTILLLEADRAALTAGFERLRQMVAAAAAPGARTEIVFYYSGHSDESGLLLGPDRVSYSEVRSWVDATGADVRIAVLDSCASGALTRTKGGVHRPPFLVDTSSAAHGHAYLTASAENESAQESDRLGAAYFTHYLVSGLRGAADTSHDGRVTLSEAYQYAFTETLARTETSRGGPQHASYDFQLTGKGDLVMTDLRATSASLQFPAEMSGRLYVRDAAGQLVAEVHKLAAQPIELGLPPGHYRVTLDDQRRLFETSVDLAAGRPTMVSPHELLALAAGAHHLARGCAACPRRGCATRAPGSGGHPLRLSWASTRTAACPHATTSCSGSWPARPHSTAYRFRWGTSPTAACAAFSSRAWARPAGASCVESRSSGLASAARGPVTGGQVAGVVSLAERAARGRADRRASSPPRRAAAAWPFAGAANLSDGDLDRAADRRRGQSGSPDPRGANRRRVQRRRSARRRPDRRRQCRRRGAGAQIGVINIAHARAARRLASSIWTTRWTGRRSAS